MDIYANIEAVWWLGNIIAGWTTYGTDKNFPGSSWAWRVPTLIQCVMPAIVMCLVLFFPESPRWLIMKDRRDEAVTVLAKYHGEGNPQAPIVELQVREIVADMSVTRNDNPWWDFKELFHTGAARYRLYMVILMSFFGQWYEPLNGKSKLLPQTMC